MNKKVNGLKVLINSCNIEIASSTTATEKIGINFYRNQNNNVLIYIGSLKKETEEKCLNNLEVISKEELFIRLSTGCIAPSSIDYMLGSFDEYHHKSVLGDISSFLQSLEARKVILCYTNSMGESKAVLVILHKMCQKADIDCIPIILKPALFKGNSSYNRDFKDLLTHIDTHKHHICDEDLSLYERQQAGKSLNLNNLCEEEVFIYANLAMKLFKHD
jgi:hypothetical protein